MTATKVIPGSSDTVIINSIAQNKIALGIKVYNLSAGEPKLPSNPHIMDGAIAAIRHGKTFYPPVAGFPELKLLAAQWLNQHYGCNYTSENCLIVNGGKFGIYLSLQLLLEASDEVIIISPYWPSYPAITKLFLGTPRIVQTHASNDWKLTPELLQQNITPKSKILVLNNATNPTGTLYQKKDLEEILSIAKANHILVISDEVYSGLTYDDQDYVSCGAFLEYKDQVLLIQSCSKNFAMTGWRIGFVMADTKIINMLTSLISQSTSGVTSVSQYAAIAALKNVQPISRWVCESMQKNRNIMLQGFQEYFGLDIKSPASSLYYFVALNDLGIATESSALVCKKILEEVNVALVPGSTFGKEGYIRFSFGAQEQDIRTGMKLLSDYIKSGGLNL